MPISPLGTLAIAGGASLLGQGIGGAFSARARRKARRARRQQARETSALYSRLSSEDALQRGAAQRSLNYLRQRITDNAAARRGTQAVTGSTTAATAAGAQADMNALASAAGNIVASNDTRKDKLATQAQAARNSYLQAEAADKERQSAELGNAAAAATSANGNVAASYLGGVKSAADTTPATPKPPGSSLSGYNSNNPYLMGG